jgi:hypothetical protein
MNTFSGVEIKCLQFAMNFRVQIDLKISIILAYVIIVSEPAELFAIKLQKITSRTFKLDCSTVMFTYMITLFWFR